MNTSSIANAMTDKALPCRYTHFCYHTPLYGFEGFDEQILLHQESLDGRDYEAENVEKAIKKAAYITKSLKCTVSLALN